MPYWRQAVRRLRPLTRTRWRISGHFSMSVNTPVPHCWCPRWSVGRHRWQRGSGPGQGRGTSRPPVGYPAGRCTLTPPFRVIQEGGKSSSKISSFTSPLSSPEGTVVAFGMFRVVGGELPLPVRVPASGGPHTPLVTFPASTTNTINAGNQA